MQAELGQLTRVQGLGLSASNAAFCKHLILRFVPQ